MSRFAVIALGVALAALNIVLATIWTDPVAKTISLSAGIGILVLTLFYAWESR